MLSFVKWTGSKRYQANWIASMFPRSISGRYAEMFLGSGIVLLTHLRNRPNARCIANDLCRPLIDLWTACRDSPVELIKDYREMWSDFNSKGIDHRKECFNAIRTRFNENQSKASHFLFLTRTSINGLVRFNSKGLYNAPPHFSRPGMHPDELSKILLECSSLVQNVEFTNKSYEEIELDADDFAYMDPPYAMAKDSIYLGGFDSKKFYAYVERMPCRWLMSYNGLAEGSESLEAELPRHLYRHRYLGRKALSTSRNAAYGDVKDKRYVQESLYASYDPDKPLTLGDFE